jgi:hypothetical protein
MIHLRNSELLRNGTTKVTNEFSMKALTVTLAFLYVRYRTDG